MSSKELRESVDSLKNEYNLTTYEALQIALKKEELRLYKQANVLIGDGTKTPSALEMIGVCLGATSNQLGQATVRDLLAEIAENTA